MTNKIDVYLLPERWRVLSGSWLKVIAMVSMTIDHVAAYLLRYDPDFTATLFTVGSKQVSWYFLMRCIGRLAFPLFAFLLVEGFLHTSNRMKYGRNLLLFALFSEIPWVLLHNGVHLSGHNVMFTLLAGFLGLCAIERYRTQPARLAGILLGMMALLIVLSPDYGGTGFAFIILLYTLRRHLLLQVVIGSFMLPMRWIAGLAFIPIALYNGQRGFIHGRYAKYLFYAFYPLHLLLIFVVQQMR
jgi:hypothetical protein